MRSIILCEGKTDAILYSYYLGKVCGWESLDKKENQARKKEIAKRLTMQVDNSDTQEFYWYFRGDDILCIYAVGSKNNFADGVKQVVDINEYTSNDKFNKIAVISDRDDIRSENSLIKDITDSFSNSNIVFKQVNHNEWNKSDEYEYMGETYCMSLLPLVVPFEESGTIETFLLNCRKEIGEGEQTLVGNIYSFIDGLMENEYIRSHYLFKRGLIPKSKLGTYFSIVSPGRTFDGYNKILESIPWEKYLEFRQSLKLLSEI